MRESNRKGQATGMSASKAAQQYQHGIDSNSLPPMTPSVHIEVAASRSCKTIENVRRVNAPDHVSSSAVIATVM
ncbi:hypothetical protein RRSWK_05370 [Rhodopirellula sp. SWK7]|nr:hypothetical protein RRSWK_05370 [Rhodopirellula sp. SWK7]